MALTSTTIEELHQREIVAFDRFLALLEEVPPTTPVGDGGWDAHAVAAHLLTVFRRYTERDRSAEAGLSPTMAAVDEQNEAELASVRTMSLAEVLDSLRQQQERFLDLPLELDVTYPFHFHQRVDAYGGLGNLLGELLVHGYDVARAARLDWRIEPRDAVLVLNGVFQFTPGLVSPTATRDLTATFEFRVRGGRPHTLVVDRGSARMVESAQLAGRPDVVLGGPGVPFLLNLYGRIGTARAALRGVAIRGGRRPWLGLRLTEVFDLPVG